MEAPDAAADAGDASAVCTADEQCDDGTFCTAAARCNPGAARADTRGCIAGAPRCMQTQVCDEEARECVTQCAVERDADQDGHEAKECGGEDCDDSDANRYEGNEEVCDAEGHDEDCDPETFGERDTDGDDFVDALCCNADGDERTCGEDCDDFDRGVSPEGTEVCDFLDNDCDGEIDEEVKVEGYLDADRDLHGDRSEPLTSCPGSAGFAEVAGDCDDSDKDVYRDNPELCDDRDNDCDETVDEDAQPVDQYRDLDGDGFGHAASGVETECEPLPGYSRQDSDCDDRRPDVSPLAQELCDGRNNDCDDRTDEGTAADGYHDADQDGFGSDSRPRRGCLGQAEFALEPGDCDDERKSVYPEASEVCDELDNDCDGDADEGVRVDGFRDADRDLHGDPDQPLEGCAANPEVVSSDDDCDDDDPRVHHGQPELCDDVDNDCDEKVDEDAGPVTWYRDADGDGFGDALRDTLASCAPLSGYAHLPLDCDDARASVSPLASERCDGIDNDCNGAADFALGQGDGEDDDGDGFADAQCPGVGRDCDDETPTRYPGAPETCDSRDNDCDRAIDEGSQALPLYRDADGDGFGSSEGAAPIVSCEPILGYVPQAGDCDDEDSRLRPGVNDGCDGIDADCDGQLDEAAPRYAFYVDSDGDGTAGGTAKIACEAPDDAVLVPADCAEGVASVHPGAAETCDGVDQDCDGEIDEGVSVSGYADQDGDLHGDPARSLTVCIGTAQVAENGDDCDDADPSVFGGQLEICDELDNDCDGEVDEDAEPRDWYPDADGDGFGNDELDAVSSCEPLAGYSITSGDCDDEARDNRPGRPEHCDGVDNDCDGDADEGLEDAQPEQCDGELDEDCDGEVDEDCECAVGSVRECGSSTGGCEPGVQACDYPGVWGICIGEVTCD